MCLGVPGQILDVRADAIGTRMGRVRFGGVTRDVCLAYVPEAGPGAWVLVHAGFAIQQLDEAEAHGVFEVLEELARAEQEAAAEAQARARGETPPK